MSSIIVGPCKDCEKRYPACHDKCGDYKVWKEELQRQRQAITDGKKLDSEMNSYVRTRTKANMRRKQN